MARSTASAPRERLLRTAAELFYREGIHSVGVDRIVGAADVTRATFYRHFPSKETLVEAYLELEDQAIRSLFDGVAEIEDPRTRLELLIAGLGDDIEGRHTRGCPFINASAEYPDPSSGVRRVVAAHREWFRATLEALLREAGVADAEVAARQLVLLRDAAMVGGYLDGWDTIREAFVTAARRAAGID